ncbi:MAG: GntR family transcriptional regulator [Anaerolineaceae bacterium]|nr:GntR family transcriptional regulator [Anaerolineaceae bacterium]NTV36241.1 GntR family transcriptional regulator [Anaerolineaceae bacterium]
MPLSPVNNPISLEKMAYDALKKAILTFQLLPGESMVESTLGKQLGISKTPVRDAISRLEKEGLVVKVPFKGTTVTELNHQDVVEIFQIRATLEGLAARLSAERFSPAALEQANIVVAQHRQAAARGYIEICAALNKQFHTLILAESSNQRLAMMMANLDDHLQRYRTLSNFQTGRLEKSVNEHMTILNALRSHQPEEAEAAMRDHLMSVLAELSRQDLDELAKRAHEQASENLSTYGLE